MTNLTEPTIQEMLLELKRRAKENLITSYDAYSDLVDAVVNEGLEQGEFDANEDIESLKDKLLQYWSEVLEYVENRGTECP